MDEAPHEPPAAVLALQRERFDRLFESTREASAFYRRKWSGLPLDFRPSTSRLTQLPLTTKEELTRDQLEHPPFGSNLTAELSSYTRIHQTSGTTGRPIRCLDTPRSWSWFVDLWCDVLRAAEVGPSDRVFFAFGFGPFVGFWAGFEAASQMGAMAISSGGQSSEQRIEHLLETEATVLVATPTYALRLLEVASGMNVDLTTSAIRTTIHAGEPGAGLEHVARKLEAGYSARCFDHAGATEVGPWGAPCPATRNLHIRDDHFVVEIVDPATGRPVAPDPRGIREGELVLTNLGRDGFPVVRYRTGDLVRHDGQECTCGCPYSTLVGGVLGRVDDMVVVRGINVFPSAIENVVRSVTDVAEFTCDIVRYEHRTEIEIQFESASGTDDATAAQLIQAFANRMQLRVEAIPVPSATLPRYELKARRFRIRSAG